MGSDNPLPSLQYNIHQHAINTEEYGILQITQEGLALIVHQRLRTCMRRFVFGGAAKTLSEMGLLSSGPEQASQR